MFDLPSFRTWDPRRPRADHQLLALLSMVYQGEVILETNPLLSCIGVSPGWSSLAAVSCKFDEAGLDHLNGSALSSLPSVAYTVRMALLHVP